MSVPLVINWLPLVQATAAAIITAGVGLFACLIGGTP